MPFIGTTQIEPGMVEGTQAPPDVSVDYSLKTLWDASFGLDNTLGSISRWAGKAWSRSQQDAVEGYDPFADMAGYEDYVESFITSDSPGESRVIKKQIDEERRSMEILQQSGSKGFAVQMATSLLDPINLLPIGGALAKARTLRSGLMAGSVAGLGGAAASEALLQSTQETRTGMDAAVNLTGGLILGGVLGGAAGFFRGSRDVAARELEDMAPGRGPRFGRAAGGGGGGLSATATRDLSGNELAPSMGAEVMQTAPIVGSPLARTATSASGVVRDISERLAENPMLLTKNAGGRASATSAETGTKLWQFPLYQSLRSFDEAFIAYRTGGKPGLLNNIRTGLADTAGATGGKLTRREFSEEVAKALRRGDQHSIPEVQQAAEAVRSQFLEPMRKAMVDVGLLEDSFSLGKTSAPGDTAISYFHRAYDQVKIAAQRPEFEDRITAALLRKQVKISNFFEDAARRKDFYDKKIEALTAEIESFKGPDRKTAQRELLVAEGERSRAARELARARENRQLFETDGINSPAAAGQVPRWLSDELAKIRKGWQVKPPTSLAAFIVSKGGIRIQNASGERLPYAGEVEALLGGKTKTRPGFIAHGGDTLDMWAQRAWDEGYIGVPGGERPDINDLLAALSDDLNGKPVYRQSDDEIVGRMERRAELEKALSDAGADLQEMSDAEIADLLRSGMPENGAPGARIVEDADGFVLTPDGTRDFGFIGQDIADAAGRQAAPIRLRRGDQASGLDHIEMGHGSEFIALGYPSTLAFVEDVARNFNAIYKRDGGGLDIVIETGKTGRRLMVRLEPSAAGDFYDVKTASAVRSDQFKNKERLWERTGTSSSATEGGSPSPRGQSGENITRDAPGGNARRSSLLDEADAASRSRVAEAEARLGRAHEGASRARKSYFANGTLPDIAKALQRAQFRQKILDEEIEALRFLATADEADLKDISRQIADGILGHDRDTLTGLPDDLAPNKRGSVAPRTLTLVKDAEIEDFLVNDVDAVMRMMTRSAAPDIEIARQFGRPDMADQAKEVAEDYARIRERVSSDPTLDDKARAARMMELNKAEARDMQDLTDMRDRIRGTFGIPRNPDALGWRALRVLKQVNHVTWMGSAALPSSLSDLSRSIFQHGLTRFFGSGIVPLIRNLKHIRLTADEYRLGGELMNLVLDSRLSAMSDLDQAYSPHSRFERGLDNVVRKFNVLNVMAPMTDGLQLLEGMITQTRLLDGIEALAKGKTLDKARPLDGAAQLGKTVKLSDKEIRWLASHGIDEQMAGRMWAQRKAWVNRKGLRQANVREWVNDDEAARTFMGAMGKSQRTAIQNPGQDKPTWMSTPIGGVVGQFRSFMMSATARTVVVGLQRRDAAVFQGIVTAVGFGMLAYYFQTENRGGVLSDDPGVWLKEGIDRSGITGWAFEANAIIEKATANNIGLSRLLGQPAATRYASQNTLGKLFGPSVGRIQDITQLMYASTSGDWAATDTKALRRQIPLQNLFYLRWLFDAVERGFNESTGVPQRRLQQ